MISHVILGYISWKGKMKYSISSRNTKSLVENHIERKIKSLWSNNGGEFTLEEFKELYREYGIKRELRNWYIPENNNVMEQKNQTIMDASKSMLHDQDLPMHLWDKVERRNLYVQNCTPHWVLGNTTPEEDFLG